MNASRTRSLCFLTGLGVCLACSSAQALNGNARVISCANCSVPTDFRDAAITDSYNYFQANAAYTVISNSTPRTAFVSVGGYWMPDPFNYSVAYWTVTGAATGDMNGAPLSSDIPTAQAQMSVIDVGLWGFGRSSTPKVTSIAMSPDYDSSFINSTDEMDSPGIQDALYRKNIALTDLPVGTKLMVTFSDGTRAVYVRTSATATYQWTWDGLHAWDAQGRPLSSRGGNLVNNGNTSGAGSGSVGLYQSISGDSGVWLWSFLQGQRCETTTTVTYNGTVMSSWYGLVPC